MAKRKPLTFDSKGLSDDLKASAGQGVDALFSPTPTTTAEDKPIEQPNVSVPQPVVNEKVKKEEKKSTLPRARSSKQETKQPSNHDAVQPRNHDTTVSRYDETVIEKIRKAVKQFGKDAATHRFTSKEKKVISDIIYAYKSQGIRTSENEITRIAINFILYDYRENGKNSILDKALKALNE